MSSWQAFPWASLIHGAWFSKELDEKDMQDHDARPCVNLKFVTVISWS